MKCEAIFCDRDAVRDVAGRHVCDECYLAEGHIYFRSSRPMMSSFYDRHPRLAMALLILYGVILLGSVARLLWSVSQQCTDTWAVCLLN